MVQISRLAILKFLELAITVICLAIHCNSFVGEQEIIVLVTGTFFSYIIILAGGAAGHIMSTPFNPRIDSFFSLVAVGLFVASGAMIIDRWHRASGEMYNKQMAKASLSIINAGIFLVDCVLTQRGG